MAETYIPNPQHLPIVLHKDNNKTNINVNNLKWGTVSENTKQAYKDGLIKNAKSWDDNQSIAVCVFDLDKNLLYKFGSMKECSRTLKISVTAISNQCKHNVKTKPRCGYWFRYLTEYEKEGFIL